MKTQCSPLKSLFLSALLFALVFPGTLTAGAITLVNARGATVQLADSPRRIVSLVPALTDMLMAMGAEDRIVGVTVYDTQPPAAGKTVVGGFYAPNVLKITALQPDLVLVSALHKSLVELCKQQGIATLELDLSSLSASRKTVLQLGKLVQQEENARTLNRKIETGLHLIARKTASIPKDQRLRVVRFMGNDRVMAPGDDSFQNEMIRAAGAIAPVWGENGAIVPVKLPAWRRFNPQVIYACYDDKPFATEIFKRPGWKDVDAVRNNRIYYFPCELTCRAGAHVHDFVAWLSARLYSDHFSRAEARVSENHVIDQRNVQIDLPFVRQTEVIHSNIDDFTHKTLLVRFKTPQSILSTLEGVRKEITAVGNHYYPPPCWYLGHEQGLARLQTTVTNVLSQPLNQTALLFTGADMDHLAVETQTFRNMTVYALVTAGARANAMRAAMDSGDYYEPGTINVIVMTNMQLSHRAMTRAVVAVTEAKSAALQDLDVRSSYTPKTNGATGTGTDNVIIVQGQGGIIDNTGGHSKMGELISRAVYKGVTTALYRQNGFFVGRNVLARLKERQISISRLLSQSDCPCGRSTHPYAADLEAALLRPQVATFMTAAMALSDADERGMAVDLAAFDQWARAMAGQLAQRPMADFDLLIAPDDLPPVLHTALNALANGVKAAQEH